MKSQEKLSIQENVPLAPLTTFKIGGPAKYFVEVSDEASLVEAVRFANTNLQKFIILGGGSNVLISDEGYGGLVIRIKNQENCPADGSAECEIRFEDGKKILTVWAGNSLSSVVNFAAKKSLTGLEWAAGIPGTVGGAIRGNAGAYGSEMSKSVQSVRALQLDEAGNKIPSSTDIPNRDCRFGYRDSLFKNDPSLIIVSAEIGLMDGDGKEIEQKMKDIIRRRSDRHPKESSAGSFFQNPKVENQDLIVHYERDTGEKARDGKIPAGWLIDEAGLRGKEIGGAKVSEEHGNFVVNTGTATSNDVIMLASLIKMKVRDSLGVQLREEIQYIGF